MRTQPNTARLLEIAEFHLNRVLDYDPYKRFPDIENRDAFRYAIANDPAFSPLGLDDNRYIIARIGGNLITSLHRKIGDMYEALFQYLLTCCFDLTEQDLQYSVTIQIGDRQQERSTDGRIPIDLLTALELPLLQKTWQTSKGLAFEIRSCYQIGDSKRIQADWDMARSLASQNLIPIMLVFCNTSLRSPLLRLRNSWNLFEGEDTFTFIYHLTNFDLQYFLEQNQTRLTEIITQILDRI
ncbi:MULTISPECIES: hypothetical protein [Spirulina sp. CCY15215]|uniref:hypothetical protein n=1 Tax=Spirulina sp. CCY15215 TaxID=2767591 RepID=UPI0019520EEB|nr:hypothetical protein [Spirulina major]